MAPKKKAESEGQSDSPRAAKQQKTNDGEAQQPRRSARQASASQKKEENGDKKSSGSQAAKDKDEKSTKSSAASKKTAKTDNASTSANAGAGSNTGDGTYGSKHQSASSPQGTSAGSSSRLPKVGQNVTWKAMPGWVEGHVTEIVTEAKSVGGKSVKASKEDPRVALKSHGPSGKIAVHKPDAIYF